MIFYSICLCASQPLYVSPSPSLSIEPSFHSQSHSIGLHIILLPGPHRHVFHPNQEPADLTLILLLPKLALLWRLETILDVILSGFELDLYVADERPFAYWYALRTVEGALEIVGELREVVIEGGLSFTYISATRRCKCFVCGRIGSVALSELEFQARYMEGLRDLCKGMFVVSLIHLPLLTLFIHPSRRPELYSCSLLNFYLCLYRQLTLPQLSYVPERMHLNLLKRYKWAFLPQYGVITAKPVGHPDMKAFLDACAGVLAVSSITIFVACSTKWS